MLAFKGVFAMREQIATSESAERSKRISAKGYVLIIVLVVVSFNLVLRIWDYFGFTISRSFSVQLNMYLLGAIGVCAGSVAAYLRKKGSSDAAIKAYRIAVWCLFLAFWTGVEYPFIKQHDDAIQRFKTQWQEFEKDKRENPGKWHSE
jgi:hypothetical protein